MNELLTVKALETFKESFEKNPAYKVSQRTVLRNGINESAIDRTIMASCKNTFSVDVDAGDITNQKRSGRCWMFAGLNVLRKKAMDKANLKTLELSQTYLQFFDKLEKCNAFLDRIIELADEPINSRDNMFVISTLVMDGGYWSNFANLVQKYGVVPLDAMPTTAVSDATDELNKVLVALVNQDASVLRVRYEKNKDKQALIPLKKKMLEEIYRVLAISLGVPPTTFAFECYTKDTPKKFIQDINITPQEFYEKYIGENLDDYISLSNVPLPGFEENKAYFSHLVQSVEGKKPEVVFNIPLASMKRAIIKSLKGGDLVWFASDVSAQSLRKDGTLACDVLRQDELFDVKFSLNKGNRMAYQTSFSNHAMTFTGVNLVSGRPNRFKVENSWGKEVGDNGFFTMSNQWFDEYVYQAIIKREYLPADILAAYDEAIKNPIETEPYFACFSQSI
ncbi:MAG: C1 family peptidase [Bacilli bacterium]